MDAVRVLCVVHAAASVIFACALAVFLFGRTEVCVGSNGGSELCLRKTFKVWAMAFAAVTSALGFACNVWPAASREAVGQRFGTWFSLRIGYLCLLLCGLALWCLVGYAFFFPESLCFAVITVAFTLCMCYELYFTVVVVKYVQ